MRKKMILSYAAVLLLFAGLTFVFVLRTVYGMVRDNLVEVSSQTMTRWSGDLSSVMDYGRTYILNLTTNEEIQNILRQQSTGNVPLSQTETEAVEEELANNAMLKKVMYANEVTMKNVPFLAEVCYKTNEGEYIPAYYSSRQNAYQNDTYAQNDPWIRALEAQQGRFLWSVYYNGANEFLRLSKVVYDMQDYSRSIGIISLDLSYVHLSQNVLYRMRSSAGIDAAIVQCDTGETIGYNTVDFPSSDCDVLINNKQDCLFVRRIKNTGYSLVGVKSLDEASNTYYRACVMLIAAAGGALAFGMVLAFVLSKKITKPLTELSQTMKNVQNGDLDITATTCEKGEIGELYSSFNHMIQMINSLIEENYVTRLNQKQSELNALQSQINTHFLYNTLDSINWLAKDYHATDISQLVTNLSTLLRTSLNNGDPELTVEQELSHARSYLNIQQVRFGGLFCVTEEISPEIKEHHVIKMLLQPLVENAILHSFNCTDSVPEQNKLIVSAAQEGENLVLRVRNNAKPEDLNEANRRIHARQGDTPKSYGIQSIYNRLTIAYAGEARYFYTMDDANMLTATITIPSKFTKQGRKQLPDTRG